MRSCAPQGSIPYVPWLRAPYYVWIGRHPTVGRKWDMMWCAQWGRSDSGICSGTELTVALASEEAHR